MSRGSPPQRTGYILFHTLVSQAWNDLGKEISSAAVFNYSKRVLLSTLFLITLVAIFVDFVRNVT